MISRIMAAIDSNIQRFSFKNITCIGICMSVYDGDTCDIVLGLPDETIKRMTVRLLGINSPEMKQPLSLPESERIVKREQANHAKNTLIDLVGLKSHALLRVECHDFDKYGRVLCKLYRLKDDKKENYTCYPNPVDIINDIDYIDYCINDKMLLLTQSVPFMVE